MPSDFDNKPAGRWKQRWRNLRVVGVISDLESAKRACSTAASWVFFCCVFLILNTHFPIYDARVIADAALFAGLGYGIKRMSRTCAVSALLLFIINIAFNPVGGFGHLGKWVEEGFRGQPLTQGSPLAVVLETLLFGWLLARFVEGIRGTFAYPRYANQAARAAVNLS